MHAEKKISMLTDCLHLFVLYHKVLRAMYVCYFSMRSTNSFNSELLSIYNIASYTLCILVIRYQDTVYNINIVNIRVWQVMVESFMVIVLYMQGNPKNIPLNTLNSFTS